MQSGCVESVESPFEACRAREELGDEDGCGLMAAAFASRFEEGRLKSITSLAAHLGLSHTTSGVFDFEEIKLIVVSAFNKDFTFAF